MALVLVNTLFLALATGLFVSTRARSQPGAILGAFGLLAVIAFGPIVLQWVSVSLFPVPLAMFSPVNAYFSALDTVYVKGPLHFWSSLLIGHLLGWLLVVLATFTLRHNWRAVFAVKAVKVSPPNARRLLAPPRVIMLHRDNRRRAFAPVARAMLRMRGQRSLAWFAAFIALLGSLWNAVVLNQLGSVWAAASVSQVFTLASSALFAFVAGRFFFESRRSGELELLLVTPVGARGILREQRLALLRLLLGPLYLVVFGSILAAAGGIHFSADHGLAGLFFGLCNMLSSVLGVLAVCRVAMWLGPRVNSLFALVGGAVGLVMVAPLAVMYLLPLLLVGGSVNPIFLSALAAPLLLGKNIFFLAWASQQLKREFRTSERSLWSRLSNWFTASATTAISQGKTG
jgi:hypothetical protein